MSSWTTLPKKGRGSNVMQHMWTHLREKWWGWLSSEWAWTEEERQHKKVSSHSTGDLLECDCFNVVLKCIKSWLLWMACRKEEGELQLLYCDFKLGFFFRSSKVFNDADDDGGGGGVMIMFQFPNPSPKLLSLSRCGLKTIWNQFRFIGSFSHSRNKYVCSIVWCGEGTEGQRAYFFLLSLWDSRNQWRTEWRGRRLYLLTDSV